VLAIGMLTLIGRLLNIDWIQSFSSSSTPMRPITAICFLLSAAALVCLRPKTPSHRRIIISRFCGVLVGAVGLMSVAAWLVELTTGHEWMGGHHPFLKLYLDQDTTRMAIITGLLFLDFGCVLLLLGGGGRFAAGVAHVLLLPAALLTYMALAGYIFNVPVLYTWLHLGMAMNTDLAFWGLCLAAFCVRPKTWLMSIFTGMEAGSIMARRLFPALLLLPLLIGYLRVQGEEAGYYPSYVGVTLVAAAYSFCFLVLVGLVAKSVNRVDLARRRSEQSVGVERGNLQAIFDVVNVGMLLIDQRGAVQRVNNAVARWIGKDLSAGLGKQPGNLVGCAFALGDPKGCGHTEHCGTCRIRNTFESVIRSGDPVHGVEAECTLLLDGKEVRLWLEVSADPLILDGRKHVVLALNDITARKRAEDLLRVRVQLSDLAQRSGIDELMQAALDHAEHLTGSRLGFFHSVDEDQENLTLQAWSTNTLGTMCQAQGKGLHYPISKAGVWVDCFHARAPVIHNDYASLPHKKGMPDGHAPIIRELGVPILRGNFVVGIIGVGNKATDYTQDDVDMLQNLASPVMDLVAYAQAKEALRASEELALQQTAKLRESEHRVRMKLESVLSPEGDIGNLELADIINIPAVQSLMDSFHRLAPIPMAIIDLNGKVLVGEGWQDVCTKFHRVNPESCKHCIESDVELSAGVAPGEFKLYKCKNNLWDVATPILVGGRHVGNLFMGQFFLESEPLDYELFKAQAKRYGFDEKQYLSALEAVPRLSKKAVDEAMAYFRKLSEMLSQLSYGNIKLARSMAQGEALTDSLRQAKEDLERRVAERTADLAKAVEVLQGEVDLRMTAERETRAASLYARSLLEASLDPLVTISPDGKITDVNKTTEEATGLGRTGLIGTVFSSYFTEPQKAAEGYRRVLAEGEVYNYPLSIRNVSGSTMDVLYNATVYRNEAGEVQGVFAAARDITERKRAEEELDKYRKNLEEMVRQRTAELQETAADLARSNRDLEQFAYVSSHDLQEPLRMVTGFMQLIDQKYHQQLDPVGQKYIHFAVDGARRMQQLIVDLLAYSRVGTQGQQTALVDTAQVLQRALFSLQRSVKDNKATVTWGHLPTIPADSSQLAQVFQNLIGNAIKFHGDQPPQIHVEAWRNGKYWEFSAKDNGIGIDPEFSDKIFVIFQRLHVKEKKYPGTGIGLAICKKIIERHGGRIWVESHEGQGATFHFTLPAQQ
jgi:PAS domain S-box-containing protein